MSGFAVITIRLKRQRALHTCFTDQTSIAACVCHVVTLFYLNGENIHQKRHNLQRGNWVQPWASWVISVFTGIKLILKQLKSCEELCSYSGSYCWQGDNIIAIPCKQWKQHRNSRGEIFESVFDHIKLWAVSQLSLVRWYDSAYCIVELIIKRV